MSDITAYHVSSEIYSIGQVIRLSGCSRFVQRHLTRDPHFNELEELLEKERPPNSQSRYSALYSYPALKDCRAFWEGQVMHDFISYQGTPNYYKVCIKNAFRIPSCLVNHISRRLKVGFPYSDIVNEFWNPKHLWECWEFLCEEFTVLDVVSAPIASSVYSYKDRYFGDIYLANSLWPLKMDTQ